MKKLLNEMEVYESGVDQAYYQQTGFRLGAAFAESKLRPMMIEFAEYVEDQRIFSDGSTTEQLLEQFLNEQK